MKRWLWMGIAALLALAGRESLAAGPQKFALIIGHNYGGSSLPLLRFAQRDARRLSSLLVSLGGYKRKQIELLLKPSPKKVRAAMKKIARRVRKLKGRAMFFFYYSGHARGQHFQMGNRTLPFAELLRFSKKLPVQVRVLIVDSCYSGQILRIKGARRKSSIRWLPFARTRGTAILTSSEANGRSYESDAIKGSLFTSSLLAGLRGAADKNRDQRISLSELRDYVYQKTLTRSAEQSSQVQRPSHRLELQGQGSLFLTYLKRASSRLVFAKALYGHFFLYRGAELIQDFRKAKGEGLHIGLQSGSYRLQVRRHGWLGRYAFQIRKTKAHPVKVAQFTWKQMTVRQQIKGGPGSSAPMGIGATFHYNPVSNLSQHNLGLSLSLDSGRWLRVGASYRFSDQNVLALPYQAHTVSLRLALGYGLGWGPFALWLGGHLDPELIVRSSPTELAYNAGFAAGLLCHLDYHLSPGIALRIVLSGGVDFLIFDQNLIRSTLFLDMGVGFVWRP